MTTYLTLHRPWGSPQQFQMWVGAMPIGRRRPGFHTRHWLWRGVNRYLGIIEKASGLLLILVGLVLLTATLFQLARLFWWVPPL